MRILASAATLALLVLAPTLSAQEAGLAGTWKLTFQEQNQQHTFWLLKLEPKEGKVAGSIETIEKGVPKASLGDVKLTDGVLQIGFKLEKGPSFEFEGRLPKEKGKRILGSFRRAGGPVTAAFLEPTRATSRAELSLEEVLRDPSDPRVFSLALDLLEEPGVSAKEAARLVKGTLEAAELYGPRWKAQYTVKVLDALKGQPELSEITLDLARQAEKALAADAPLTDRLGVLTTLAAALRGAKKLDEAKALDQQIDTLETKAYQEYSAKEPFKAAKVAPAGKGRAVLLELFTGAQCPPCIAADMAFDAVERAYSPADVVLLQYHVHIPGPDPLTSPASEERFEYYAKRYEEAVGGTPASLFNGKPAAEGGGGPDDAEEKFKEYRGVLDKLLASPSPLKLEAGAARQGDKVTVKASVAGADRVGAKARLRFALVEDWARYKGRNGLTYHHRVVRAMPGGAKGFALDKAGALSASVDLGELRQELGKFLDNAKLPDAQRPMRLRDLRVVAFVQDDGTGEVLQAVEVPVRE